MADHRDYNYPDEGYSYWMNNEGQVVQEEGELSPSSHSNYSRRAESDRQKKDWSRDRDHNRDRDRRRRSRSRSPDRRRRRDSRRKRDRSSDSGSSGHDQHSRRNRSRSRSRSRDRGSSRRDRNEWPSQHYEQHDYREREYDRGDSWRSSPPNSTIMVSSLPLHITENEIRTNIVMHGLVPKDIRLIRRKDTGTSRGFAFVEFNQLPEAVRWMEANQGCLVFDSQYQATLQYSISKDSHHHANTPKVGQTDWFCVNCGEHNFKRREVCFKCQSPRGESELVDDVQREISFYPTSTVLLRNLDILTTEDQVLSVLQGIPAVATLPIKSVRIGRDPLNNISRGVCYLDMNNTGDSMRLYSGLSSSSPRLEIDGREVLISYCKTANSSMSTATMAAIAAKASTPAGVTAVAAAQWSASNTAMPSGEPGSFTSDDIPRLAEYSASLYAKTPEEHTSYLQYYTQYYTSQLQTASSGSKTNDKTNPAVVAPDLSRYVYDDKSGYYYDTTSNLYYDAKTQYFYNPLTQQFCYWDNERYTFVPVPSGEGAQQQPAAAGLAGQSATGKEEKKDKPDKQDKVTVAKKIAKDMEKWAKTLNQRKESTKVAAPAPEFEPERRKEPEPGPAAAPATIDNSLNEVLQVLRRKQLAEKKAPVASSSALVSYGSDSDSSDGQQQQNDEKKLALQLESMIDWTKMACLLCKRQFNSKETLQKHQQMSDLHKQNVDAWRIQNAPKVYRDRAKERRKKFGEPEPNKHHRKQQEAQRSRHSVPEPEQPAYSSSAGQQQQPGGGPSVGSKLLQKMGWQEGQGLGKSNQGRTTIIEADRRTAQAGLGMKTYAVVGDDYRQSVRNLAMLRFKELSENDP